MTEKPPHILCLGERGFPVGFGAIQRMLLISKGLIQNGCKVTVISFKGPHSKEYKFPAIGIYEGVDYIYTSGSIYRPKGFFKRNWQKIKGKINELLLIRKLKKRNDLAGCLVSTMHVDLLLIYWIWFKINRIPLILNYDEMISAISSRSNWEKLNDYLFDYIAIKFTDAICPISDYLWNHVIKYAPNRPLFKLPVLCDYEKFKRPDTDTQETVFLYCGAASYLPLIQFVTESFNQLAIEGRPIFLNFVLGGEKKDLAKVKGVIEATRNKNNIRIFPNVDHSMIPDHYAKASALLIPLRPTIQDAARFPHKIAEYLASGKAIITTNYGEIRNYEFADEYSALIAGSYDPIEYSEKLQFVIDRPKLTHEIGIRGRDLGMQHFDHVKIGRHLKDFILQLNSNDD